MERRGVRSAHPRDNDKDALDVCLHDSALLEEVELVATLMVASGESEGRLTQAQIDELLGL